MELAHLHRHIANGVMEACAYKLAQVHLLAHLLTKKYVVTNLLFAINI